PMPEQRSRAPAYKKRGSPLPVQPEGPLATGLREQPESSAAESWGEETRRKRERPRKPRQSGWQNVKAEGETGAGERIRPGYSPGPARPSGVRTQVIEQPPGALLDHVAARKAPAGPSPRTPSRARCD